MRRVLIRRETPADRSVITEIHLAAFATDDGPPAAEAALVDQLRADGDIVAGLSLVAELGGATVGHVLGSRAHLDAQPSLAIAPLAVTPTHQGRGVGSALMHAVLAAADALDVSEAVLLGDPDYYRRFGFQPAEPLGVRPPDAQWGEHFQIRTLASWRQGRGGAFRYAPAFGIQ